MFPTWGSALELHNKAVLMAVLMAILTSYDKIEDGGSGR